MTRRVAVFVNILFPYRVELLNAVSEVPDVELKVFLCAESEAGRHWGAFDNARFEYEVVPGLSWRKRNGQTTGHFNPRAIAHIERWRPDVVVGGMTTTIGLLAYLAARWSKCPFVWWLDATEVADARDSTPLLIGAKRFLAAKADCVVASSTLAKVYASSLGAPQDRLFVSLLTVDTHSFARRVDEARSDVDDLKHRLGIDGRVLGYFGQMEDYKGMRHMVEVGRHLASRTLAPTLLFVGTGGKLEETRRLCAEAGIDAVFVGFQQPADLPRYYAMCDIFWLLSLECFGVVVVEAAAAGLPVVVSKYAGAAGDIVNDQANGWVVDPEAYSGIASMIGRLLDDDTLRRSFAAESRRIALGCGVEVARDGFLDAVRHATRAGRAGEAPR